MAYTAEDIQQLKEKALELIESKKLVFIKEVASYLPIHLATFYKYGLNRDEDILGAINANRIKMKGVLRHKWYNSPNAVLQMGLYKLLADEEELAKLSHQAVDLTSKGQELKAHTVDLSKLDTDTLLALKKAGLEQSENQDNTK